MTTPNNDILLALWDDDTDENRSDPADWHRPGDQMEMTIPVKDREIHVQIDWSNTSAATMSVQDQTHLRFDLPLYVQTEDVEHFMLHDEERIIYAMDLAADRFSAYQNLLETPENYIQLFPDLAADLSTVLKESADLGVLQIFGEDYVVEIHDGNDHADLGEYVYSVFCTEPKTLDHVLSVIADDLQARLLEKFLKMQDHYLMEFSQPLDIEPEIELSTDLDGPALTDPDTGLILVHPSLVHFSDDYIEFIAANTLSHLFAGFDEAKHDQLMNEVMPDWRERLENALSVEMDAQSDQEDGSIFNDSFDQTLN